MTNFIEHSLVAHSDISDKDAMEKFGRLALPRLACRHAVGLELGVATGYYSDALLTIGKFSRLYSIDAWADHHDSNEYLRCVSLLEKHANKSVVIRMFFDDALIHFPDDFFDFIYVDAYAHTGQQDGKLFTDWYPKLKAGGIFSGHDYDHAAWPKTVAAVDEFALLLGKEIEVIGGSSTAFPEDAYPSWYFIK